MRTSTLIGHQCLTIFDDGETAVIDVKPHLKRSVFKPLEDKSFFRQVRIDRKFDGVQWPNGADVCINWIEAETARQKSRILYA